MPLQQSSILYQGVGYPHYYLCNYLPVSVGKDTLSHSLLKFKRGLQPDLNTWIGCALDLLSQASAPPGPLSQPSTKLPGSLIPPDCILLRALHHDETLVHPKIPGSLDKLGQALAARFHGHYLPHLLRKSLPTREIKALSLEQRQAELQDLYYLDTRSLPVSPPSFLLIDDILTTGTTMKMMITAILQTYPTAQQYIFTLTKADYDKRLNKKSPLSGKNYQFLESLNQSVVEETSISYKINKLAGMIRNDTF